MFGLVDGETVVAAVKAVTTEESDRVVDTDVVEVLDTVVCADVAEETDVFFLALSDCVKIMRISTSSGFDKGDGTQHDSRQSPDQVLLRNPEARQRSGRRPNPPNDE
jgi:hypothetical protein